MIQASNLVQPPSHALEIITVLAILLSPVIAVGVTLWYQHRKERRDLKRWALSTLLATRHSALTDEAVRALNLIDLIFANSSKVRSLWHEYYDMLSNKGLDNPLGYGQRERKKLELITQMANELGYSKEISHLDVDRVYYPTGLGNQNRRAEEISDELLRVLKGTQGFAIAPRAEPSKEQSPLP